MAALGLTFDAQGNARHQKDPDARLPYTWNLGGDVDAGKDPWLATGETIANAVVAIDNPTNTTATVDGQAFSTTVVTGVLKGGTVGDKVKLRCRVTTSLGYIDDFTITVSIKEH